MTESQIAQRGEQLDHYPLRDTAIYNPHLLSKAELIGLFVARQKLLENLLDELTKTSPGKTPQHHLLVGQRGMGKTMLLRRFHFAVEDSSELAAVWLPLTFPEEQYNVGRLSDLWLNCIDALGDALDRLGHRSEADRLDARRDELLDLEEEQRSRETLQLLVGTATELGRRLILLIDNIDLILERISKQGWALREILSEESAILLIGASSRTLESSYKYDQPFYDFFQIHELGGLRLEEATGLLRHYAEQWNNEVVLRILSEEPARLRTLHTLAGGNPRTLALLYNILGRGLDGGVRSDLESLLDQCTPLYKARLEALAPQQQRVAHTLAVYWHPATAAQIADELRLDVKAVSSQLTRLVNAGVVEAVSLEPSSKSGFQLAERFFNIWYLMRATRRARRQLVWLVEFLRMLYSQAPLSSSDTLVCVLARNGRWAEAFEHAPSLVFESLSEGSGSSWSHSLGFFREAVFAGKAREAADLLKRVGIADRWQPLHEALETVALGRRSYLKRLAPEIRQPTEEILKQLGWNPAAAQREE